MPSCLTISAKLTAVPHSLRRCNYGLFFRFNDRLYGTYKRFDVKAYDVKYWTAKVKAGEGMTGKLASDCKSRFV